MHDKPEHPPKKRIWLRYLIATLLVALLLRAVPVSAIWSVLTNCDPILLGIAAVTIIAARLLGALRSKLLLDHQGISFSLLSIFQIGCASTLYGLLLPGSYSGGLIRWYRFSRPQNGYSEVFAALIAERVIDFLVLALFGLLCLRLEEPLRQLSVAIWGLSVVAGLCLFVFTAMVFGLGIPIVGFLRKFTRQSKGMPHTLPLWIDKFGNALVHFNSLGARKAIVLIAISLLFHTVSTLTFFLMAEALDLDLAFASFGWIRAATILLTVVPLTPSGVGIREFSLIYLLRPFSVPAPNAVAFSVLQYAGILFVALIGGSMDIWRYLCAPLKVSKHEKGHKQI